MRSVGTRRATWRGDARDWQYWQPRGKFLEAQLMRLLRWLCCAAALTAVLAPAAHADEYDKLTYLTFSGPVQVPGATLAPGTYMFKLADSQANRHIVQVFDKNGSKLFATLLAIPDRRMEAPEKNIVLFGERPAGSPQAIKAWWYPGDSYGDEFVYPKSQALKIARDVHKPVLSMNDEGSSDRAKMKGAKVGRVNENGEVVADDTTSSASDRTATTTTDKTTTDTAKSKAAKAGHAVKSTIAKAAEKTKSAVTGTTGTTETTTTGNRKNAKSANANTANSTSTTSRRELPRTASDLPLAALLSALAFAGAAGAHQLRKRAAGRV
jgi:hypothetical protein